MTALRIGRATMDLLPNHDPLRLIILDLVVSRNCNHEMAAGVQCNKLSNADPPTGLILPAQNDCIAERVMDRISFDKAPSTKQEYRAAGTRTNKAAAQIAVPLSSFSANATG
jgi:hypothetical protein